MVDETTDAGTEEQCVLVIRWIEHDLEVHDDFIGLYATAITDALYLSIKMLFCA